jgi:hypothetical protein
MRDERDFYGMTPPCRIHRGRTEGVDPAIYAGPIFLKEKEIVKYCKICGQRLNWINASRPPFLCHLCQKKEVAKKLML